MAKQRTTKEMLAKLETENNYQTSSINELKVLMTNHIVSSDKFRLQVTKNTTTIGGLKWVIGIIVGMCTGVTVWIVSVFITK